MDELSSSIVLARATTHSALKKEGKKVYRITGAQVVKLLSLFVCEFKNLLL